MAENISDLMTQLEQEEEGSEDGIRHPREFRSIRAFEAHLSTKLGGTTTTLPSLQRSITIDPEAQSYSSSSPDSSPPFSLSSFSLPLPISPLNEDFFPIAAPSPHSSPSKRRRNEISPTPPPSPQRNSSSSSSSSSFSRPTPPGSPTHSASPESFLERCIERYDSNPDAFTSFSAWEFYNPQLTEFTFHPPTIQLRLNELSKDDTVKVWERELEAVRLINDAGFAQVHQQLGDNNYQMVYDPERNEMAFVPIKASVFLFPYFLVKSLTLGRLELSETCSLSSTIVLLVQRSQKHKMSMKLLKEGNVTP